MDLYRKKFLPLDLMHGWETDLPADPEKQTEYSNWSGLATEDYLPSTREGCQTSIELCTTSCGDHDGYNTLTMDALRPETDLPLSRTPGIRQRPPRR